MFARFEIGVVGFSTIHDAEALIVLDFLRPDDPVGVGRLDHRQVGVEDRVDKYDQHRFVDMRPGQRHRPRRPVLHCLFDERARHVAEGLSRVPLDDVLEVTRDVDDLRHVAESPDVLEHVVHHRLAGDAEHRLRRDVRVRTEARSPPGERDDHLHGALVPSRP